MYIVAINSNNWPVVFSGPDPYELIDRAVIEKQADLESILVMEVTDDSESLDLSAQGDTPEQYYFSDLGWTSEGYAAPAPHEVRAEVGYIRSESRWVVVLKMPVGHKARPVYPVATAATYREIRLEAEKAVAFYSIQE